MKMNEQLSKRWSTYCNVITIVMAAFTPLVGQFGIPESVMPYVLLATSTLTLGAQAIKQGQFDD